MVIIILLQANHSVISTKQSIIRLLNACPRLTHLSLTGVHAFLRNEFQQFGRDPPPEFTEHQRSVFCVFSGTCVKRLRDYLNTAPEYEALRNQARRRESRPAGQGQGTGAPQTWDAGGEPMEVEGQVPLPPPPPPPPQVATGDMGWGAAPIVVGTPIEDTPEPESET